MLSVTTVVVVSAAALANSAGGLVRFSDAGDGCTIGVAHGSVTTDGRPLLWKVRDIGLDSARQQMVYVTGSPYSCIGVCTEGEGIYMGLNQAGVASGNSLVKFSTAPAPNSWVQTYILQSFGTVDQIKDYFRSGQQAGTCQASSCFPFIDAAGAAKIFEVERSNSLWAYDSLDPGRQAQGVYGFVVRANEFHMRPDGTDNTSIGGRYASGVYNVLGLILDSALSAKSLVQGPRDGQGYREFVRYGPGRELAAIARDTTHSAIVVHGVLPDEDPALATMWVLLGQTNYSIAVPTWARVSDVPPCLAGGVMYDRARSLWLKGNEELTQASVFPAEAHLFEVVTETLLPHWRACGAPSVSEMTRIENRMAQDAYSLLDCLDRRKSNNQAPTVSFVGEPNALTWSFTVTADDPNGVIAAIEWDFGGGCHSAEISPSHVYNEPGTYLVSCTVTDDDGVSVTAWQYYEVPGIIDIARDDEQAIPRDWAVLGLSHLGIGSASQQRLPLKGDER